MKEKLIVSNKAGNVTKVAVEELYNYYFKTILSKKYTNKSEIDKAISEYTLVCTSELNKKGYIFFVVTDNKNIKSEYLDTQYFKIILTRYVHYKATGHMTTKKEIVDDLQKTLNDVYARMV